VFLQNIIDYVQISTIGNAIDFGDLKNIQYGNYALSSPTRGLNASGGPTINGLIEYITISSKGNSVDFGNLTASIHIRQCLCIIYSWNICRWKYSNN
jgi:hypothetical protein